MPRSTLEKAVTVASWAYLAHRAGTAVSNWKNRNADLVRSSDVIDRTLAQFTGEGYDYSNAEDDRGYEFVSQQDVARQLHELHNEAVGNWRDAERPLEGPLYDVARYVQERLLSAGFLILDSDLVGKAVEDYHHYVRCLREWRAAGCPNPVSVEHGNTDDVVLMASLSIAQDRVLVAGFSIAPSDRVRPKWLDTAETIADTDITIADADIMIAVGLDPRHEAAIRRWEAAGTPETGEDYEALLRIEAEMAAAGRFQLPALDQW